MFGTFKQVTPLAIAYSCPLVSMGEWFWTHSWIPKSGDAQDLLHKMAYGWPSISADADPEDTEPMGLECWLNFVLTIMQNSLLRLNHNLHLHCTIDRYLSCFYFWTIVNHPAMNIFLQIMNAPMDGGAWLAIVHGVMKSRTWLSS